MAEEAEGRVEVPHGPAPARHGEPFTFSFNGRRIPAYEGDTVGSALHAAGVRVLMRSIKYHRPRGLFCNVGACASCLVRVDGVPNERACLTPARAGMRVETQNSFPSARHDVLAVVDKVYRREFDYHDKFIRPRFMTPVYHGVIRRMAGFGKLPGERDVARRPPLRSLACDVLVVGGGAAGLGAAAEAAEAGARVALVEASARLGGSLLHETRPVGPEGERGPQLVAAAVGRLGRARLLDDTSVVGAYLPSPSEEPVQARASEPGAPFEGTVAALAPRNLWEISATRVVVCTGSHENPALFAGNDLPGVLGARGAQMLLLRHGVLPGRRPVVVGGGELADLLVEQLADAGVEASRVADADRVLRADGRTEVRALRVRGEEGGEERIACDAVLLATGRTPRIELLQQTDCALRQDAALGGLVPVLDEEGRATAPGMSAAGDAAGLKGAYAAHVEGRIAGAAAARDAGAHDGKSAEARIRDLRRELDEVQRS